jgi:hypothetical protein
MADQRGLAGTQESGHDRARYAGWRERGAHG